MVNLLNNNDKILLTNNDKFLDSGRKPLIKPKPLGLRRERSDLTGGCVARIARYIDGGSPNRAESRKALVPPSSGIDDSALVKCLEELKKRR